MLRRSQKLSFILKTLNFIKNSDPEAFCIHMLTVKSDKSFFIWHNTTRSHVWTHLSDKYLGKSGYGLYADAMMKLDDTVGALLAKLDELGIADHTIVVFSTDNGAEKFTFPDGGTIPFRGEKGTTWEGGFRVPAAGNTTLKEDLILIHLC